MTTEFDKIKEEKIQEAKDLFGQIGITEQQEDDYNFSEIPSYSENSNSNKEDSKFHWTRLSINSNNGCIID